MAVILQMADVHLGASFDMFPETVASVCRKAQMDALRQAVAYAAAHGVQAILIAGNLFHMPVPPHETAEQTFGVLAEAPCPVLIAPGNYDYLHEASPYRAGSLADNIHVYDSEELSPFPLDADTTVWGAASREDGALPEVPTDRKADSLLLLHVQETPDAWLETSGFSYAALGCGHQYSGVQHAGQTAWACAGALTGLGFQEPDAHGFISGTAGRARAEMSFFPSDGVTFLDWEQPMTQIASDRELSRAIAERILHSKNTAAASRACDRPAPPEELANACLSLRLTGARHYEPDVEGLLRVLDAVFLYACVEDKSAPPKDPWRYLEEEDLRGAVTRRFRGQYQADRQEETLYALRVALAAFEGEELPPR